MKRFLVVRELLGDGDKIDANPGTFNNVLLDIGAAVETCGPMEVVVSVHAATVNYPDLLQTVGGYQHKPPLPYTPGTEAAGQITKIGSAVTGLQVGDRVAFGGLGCMASEVVVAASACWIFPPHFSFAEAAAFSTGYVTAYHCLVERAGLRANDIVLINGATGGMGMAAVQIARCIGAQVIATGGSDEKLEEVRRQGAQHVVNYRQQYWRHAVKAVAPAGVDVVFDPVGGEVFEESLRCVRYGCRYCIVGFTSRKRVAARTNLLLIKGLSLLGCRAGEAVRQGQADQDARMGTLRSWAREGKLRPYISHVFPLEQGSAAFRVLWDRQVVGRCVVAPHGVDKARSKL